MYIYIYIYIYIEREIQHININIYIYIHTNKYVYVYIYIYMPLDAQAAPNVLQHVTNRQPEKHVLKHGSKMCAYSGGNKFTLIDWFDK